MCTGALVHHEQTVRERMARPGRRRRRVCTGAPVHREQTLRWRRQRDSVCGPTLRSSTISSGMTRRQGRAHCLTLLYSSTQRQPFLSMTR